MTRFRAAPWLLVLGLTSAGGCGGAEPAPMDPSVQPAKQAPGHPPAREPVSELSALEHDLAMSEGRLDQHLRRAAYVEPQQPVDTPAPLATAPGPGPTAPPPPATAEPSTPSPGPAPAESPVHRKELAGSPCDMACRALASMRRAADGICRLTGAGSERCELARGRVRRAEERLEEAGCECH